MTNKKDYAPIDYICNGATIAFPFDWKILDEKTVIVKHYTEEQNTILEIGKDYTVNFDDTGGNIETKIAYPAGDTITIERKASLYQEKAFSTSSGFQASEIEKAFDNTSIVLQDMDFKISNFIETFSESIENKMIENKKNLDEEIQNNKNDTDSQIEDFIAEVNTKIKDVSDAAKKINELEEAVTNAKNSADFASNKADEINTLINDTREDFDNKIKEVTKQATIAENKANEVSEKVDSAIDIIEAKTNEEIEKINKLGLDNKSNIDLSNLSNPGKKTIDGQWVKIAPIKVSSGLLLGSKATKIFDVSSAVPDDDCCYDLIIKVEHHSGVGAIATVSYYKDDSTIIEMLSTRSQNANAVSTATGRVVVDKNRKIAAKSAEVSVTTLDLYILGYRRLGTNE